MLEDILKDLNKWKDISRLWTGKLNIVNMVLLSKAIYKFNAIPINNPKAFSEKFKRIEILKFIWNTNGLFIQSRKTMKSLN